MVTLLATLPFLSHLFVEPPLVGGVLSRWRPQQVNGNILSLTGDAQYTLARVLVETHEDAFGLWHEEGAFFLCRNDGGNSTSVLCACWTGRERLDAVSKRQRFAEVHRWYTKRGGRSLRATGTMGW